MIDCEKIYKEHTDRANEENRQIRYVGKEKYYSGSSSGHCSRKHYYKCIEKAEPTNLPNAKSKRIMRLGTVWHDDMEKALRDLPKD